MKNVLNILIAENIPSLNKGEMTIFGGMLQSFKVLGKVNISMFSAVPSIDQQRYLKEADIVDVGMWKSNIKNKILRLLTNILLSLVLFLEHFVFVLLYKLSGRNFSRVMKNELWQRYADCDVIIIGHDNSYGILVGISFFYYTYLPLFAKLINKPIVFYGGSILKEQHPVWLWRKILGFSLKFISSVTLRERITYERLQNNHLLSSKIIVTGDPAFLLQPATEERISNIWEREGLSTIKDPIIGITLTYDCAVKSFSNLKKADSYSKHNRVISQAIDYLVERYSAFIVFLPHSIGLSSQNDDRIIANHLLQQCKYHSHVKVITGEYSASELKGIIGQCDLFIGERIHSTINALSMEIPSLILINKDDQRSDIIRMLGQESSLFYINEFNFSDVKNKIDYVWSCKDNIKAKLREQICEIKERAMQNGILLKSVLVDVPKKL